MILCETGGILGPRRLISLAWPILPSSSTHLLRSNPKAVSSEIGPQPYPTSKVLLPTSEPPWNVSTLCSNECP